MIIKILKRIFKRKQMVESNVTLEIVDKSTIAIGVGKQGGLMANFIANEALHTDHITATTAFNDKMYEMEGDLLLQIYNRGVRARDIALRAKLFKSMHDYSQTPRDTIFPTKMNKPHIASHTSGPRSMMASDGFDNSNPERNKELNAAIPHHVNIENPDMPSLAVGPFGDFDGYTDGIRKMMGAEPMCQPMYKPPGSLAHDMVHRTVRNESARMVIGHGFHTLDPGPHHMCAGAGDYDGDKIKMDRKVRGWYRPGTTLRRKLYFKVKHFIPNLLFKLEDPIYVAKIKWVASYRYWLLGEYNSGELNTWGTHRIRTDYPIDEGNQIHCQGRFGRSKGKVWLIHTWEHFDGDPYRIGYVTKYGNVKYKRYIKKQLKNK